MFRIIFIFAFLALGLYVGTSFSGEQGYAIISMAGYTLEMSVVTLVLSIVVLFVVLLLIEFILKKLLSASSKTFNWFSNRKHNHSLRNTNEAMVKLLEGDWKAAEKKATRWANYHDTPLLPYLIASEAAQGMGDTNKRDEYLALAKEQNGNNLAIELTQAKQYIRNREYVRACDLLEELNNEHPTNLVILNLLKETYINIPRWKKLEELLPKLQKRQVITNDESANLFYQAKQGLMLEAGETEGVEGLVRFWGYLPKKQKQDPQMVEAIVHQLAANQGHSEAYIILRDAIKSEPKDLYFKLLGSLALADAHPAVQMVEKNISRYGETAAKYAALGHLYMQAEKWQEAEQAFEKSLALESSVENYRALVITLEKQNKTKEAAELSRKALSLVS